MTRCLPAPGWGAHGATPTPAFFISVLGNAFCNVSLLLFGLKIGSSSSQTKVYELV